MARPRIDRRRITAKSTPSVLITTDFARPHANGVAQYVELVASSLAPIHSTILTYSSKGLPTVEKSAQGSLRRIPCVRLLGDTFRIPRGIPSLERHTVVITNTRFFTTSALGAWLAHRWDATHIHIEHGNQHVPHHNPLVRASAWLYDQTIGRAIITRAHTVVCVSQAGVSFVKKLGAKRVIVIPNAIDATRFAVPTKERTRVRARLGIGSDERLILGVGRLVQEKGFAELIDAVRDLDVRLVIIGDGPERANLELYAAQAHVDVVFLGARSPEDLPAYYAAADVFVNPSWAEGLPTTVLEALAAKTPVIATDVGGTREILPKELLVPAHDVQALRRKIKAGLKPHTLHPMFTHTIFARSWKRLLEKLY